MHAAGATVRLKTNTAEQVCLRVVPAPTPILASGCCKKAARLAGVVLASCRRIYTLAGALAAVVFSSGRAGSVSQTSGKFCGGQSSRTDPVDGLVSGLSSHDARCGPTSRKLFVFFSLNNQSTSRLRQQGAMHTRLMHLPISIDKPTPGNHFFSTMRFRCLRTHTHPPWTQNPKRCTRPSPDITVAAYTDYVFRFIRPRAFCLSFARDGAKRHPLARYS